MGKITLVVAKVKEAGWYALCERIVDYHIEVTKSFCHNFKDSTVNVGGLEFSVTKESIAHAISIAPKGEKWYKRQSIDEYYGQFLLPTHRDPVWIQGIQRTFLLEEWSDILHIIQRYVTCEGRFATIYLYHMWFIQHISSTKRLNLPYFS